MDLNNLLNESANGFKSLQADAARLAEKWTATGLLEGLSNEQEKSSMAMILENQAKELIKEQSSTNVGGAAHGGGAGEQWAGVALPLVRKVFAQIAAKDFVSVQPMNLPSGLVFYLDFKYGSGVNGRSASDNMYGNVTEAGTKMGVDTEAAGGLYGAGSFGYTINEQETSVANRAHTALTSADSASVNYDADLDAANFSEVSIALPSGADVQGVRAFRLVSGSGAGRTDLTTNPEFTYIDSSNNVVFVVADSSIPAGGVTGSMLWHKQPAENTRGDFEDAGANAPISIPEINVELASEAIVAKTRKLKAQWTPEFAQDLNAYHSVDAEAELTSILSEYISMEIDLEILDMLILDAATTEKWSARNNKVWESGQWSDPAAASTDFYNTQGQWFQTLGTKIQKVSNKIHQKTLRGGANFLVCSPSVATILESIPGYAAQTDGDKMDFAMGVQRVGNLASRFKVYKNPYMTENTILMGYRGSQFLETGAVYAPYVPLMMTPLVYDPDTFTPRKGIMTRYAKKMIRPEFYGKIYVSDLASI